MDAESPAQARQAREQPRWLGNVDAVSEVVEACLQVDGRLHGLSRVCRTLRKMALPLAFRRLELGDDARLSAVREAQIAARPELLEGMEALVIAGDCPAAGRWIVMCSPHRPDIVLDHPRRATALVAFKALRKHPPFMLTLNIEPATHGERFAIDRILRLWAARTDQVWMAIRLRTGTKWIPEIRGPLLTGKIDFASDRPELITAILGHMRFLLNLRLQRLGKPKRYRSIWPHQPLFEQADAGTIIDSRARSALGALRTLDLVDIGYCESELAQVLDACPLLRWLRLARTSDHSIDVPSLGLPPPRAYPSRVNLVMIDLPLEWGAIVEHVDGIIGRQRTAARLEMLERLRIVRRVERTEAEEADRAALVRRAWAVGLQLEFE